MGKSLKTLTDEDRFNLLVSTVRYYAERENAAVEYAEKNEKGEILVYEKDWDEGKTAQYTLNLLSIYYDERKMPKGYELVPAKLKEMELINNKQISPLNILFNNIFTFPVAVMTVFAIVLFIVGTSIVYPLIFVALIVLYVLGNTMNRI